MRVSQSHGRTQHSVQSPFVTHLPAVFGQQRDIVCQIPQRQGQHGSGQFVTSEFALRMEAEQQGLQKTVVQMGAIHHRLICITKHGTSTSLQLFFRRPWVCRRRCFGTKQLERAHELRQPAVFPGCKSSTKDLGSKS